MVRVVLLQDGPTPPRATVACGGYLRAGGVCRPTLPLLLLFHTLRLIRAELSKKSHEDLEFVGLQIRDEGVDRGAAGGRGGDARAGDHVRASLRSD